MTSLTVQNGALVLRGASLGTGQGCCCGPSGESCDYLNCVTFAWDLEHLSYSDYQDGKTTWLPSSGTATIRCAGESRQLIALSLESCFGSGATAEVAGPTGYERADMGPITAVAVNSPGSGYAKLGRAAPTLTVSGGSGTGLTVTPTLTATNDSCGIPTWSITAVKFSGGTGYENGEALTVTAADGDTTEVTAVLTVQTEPRSEPTLSASVSGGTGATLAVSLASNGDTPQTWGVSSVSVSGATSGYTDGAAVTFSYWANVTEQVPAVAVIKTARTTPTVTASVSGGSGASLTVNLSQSPATPSDTALWHVDSVTVADGGTGYTEGDPVTFTVTDGTELVAATGTLRVQRLEPTLSSLWVGRFVDDVFVKIDGGAVITPNMTNVTLDGDPRWWTPSSVTITDGGTGYEVGDLLTWSEPYDTLSPFGDATANPDYDPDIVRDVADSTWAVTSVDGSGAITGVELAVDGYYYLSSGGVIGSVTVTEDGDYYKATSTISRVAVTNPGKYYYYTGVPTGVTIGNGGQYYRADASLPPYVADVTVTITQSMPSEGTGAELSAVIDTDTGSMTFGQITGVAVSNGGNGYLARRTTHPDGLLMMCVDANGTQAENVPPDFPPFDPIQREWLIYGPADPATPAVLIGFPPPDYCCGSSFITNSDFSPGQVVWPLPRGYYEHSEDVDGTEIVTIRGTVTETTTPIWFAEDCECENPLP